MKIEIKRKAAQALELRNYSFFPEYIKLLGTVLFAISLTLPVLMIMVMDVELEVTGAHKNLVKQLIWDKPIIPYVGGFVILLLQWFKFVEINHHLVTTDLKHILLILCFFFFLCLYPFFEMNIEFTSGVSHSRAIFSAAWGLMGFFQYWQISYASKAGLLQSNLSDERIKSIKQEVAADPIVAIICIGLSYISLEVWVVGLLILVPLVNYIMANISVKT